MASGKRVHPFPITPSASAAELIERMGNTAFQARSLAEGLDIWRRMLEDDSTIFFGLAGAMVPAGMRQVVSYLIQNRFVDVVVSTGANLYHDLQETLGWQPWQGHPHADDARLKKQGLFRIYDVLEEEKSFRQGDTYVAEFAATLDRGRPYTTREFLCRLGQRLAAEGKGQGILTTAAAAGVPIYCPALGDSSMGIALAEARAKTGLHFIFDIIGDVWETAEICRRAAVTGVVYVGGGTPKNFIQQTEVTASSLADAPNPNMGHSYAVQITADAPQWGGLSGCTFSEAQSWGKIAPKARTTTINADATIALPLLVSALAERHLARAKKRQKPTLHPERERLFS